MWSGDQGLNDPTEIEEDIEKVISIIKGEDNDITEE